MRAMFTSLLAVIVSWAGAQCPDFAITTVSENCIGVVWFEEVPDLPDSMFCGDECYTLYGGFGTIISAALYSRHGMADEDPMVCIDLPLLFNGTMSINGDVCDYQFGFLPIDLVSFRAEILETGILLEWKVAPDFAGRNFVVERSPDGNTWQEVGWSASPEGMSSTVEYAWLDEEPLQGSNYYRLLTFADGGDVQYSGMIHVYFTTGARVYPNPARDILNVNGSFELFDSFGRKVAEGRDERLDISGMPRGMYIVRTQDGYVSTVIFN